MFQINDSVTYEQLINAGFTFVYSCALRNTYRKGTVFIDVCFGVITDIYNGEGA